MIDAKDLLKLQAFPEELYNELSLATLTAYSTYLLSQLELPATLENVAVVNYKLFPRKFAMVGWPQFPDVNRTNRSVLQMRPKYRNWATSITARGIFLNDRGIAEAHALCNRLGMPRFQDASAAAVASPVASARGPKRLTRTLHPEDVLEQVRKSKLFCIYEQGRWPEAEAIDVIDFLGVYDHTPSIEKRRRLRELRRHAEQLEDDAVKEFIDLVSSTFKPYLNRGE